MTDKFVKLDDLQTFCDNQKDHAITPNDFQRMKHYEFGWHTGTPTEEGWYLYKGHDLGGIFYDTEYLPKGFSWQYPNDVDEWMLLDK